MRSTARLAVGAAALACVAALAACTSSGGGAGGLGTSGGSTPTTAPSTPGGGASTPSTPPATPTTPVTPAGHPKCATKYLQASIGASQGTAGSTHVAIDLKNISGSTCTLYGYPGVSLAGGDPITQIGSPADEDKTLPRVLVTLKANDIANAQLVITDAGNLDPGTCGPAPSTYLQIYPPNQTTPIYLGFTSQACTKPVVILNVSVMHAGTGG